MKKKKAFDIQNARERLALLKERASIKYGDSSNENKAIGLRLINQATTKQKDYSKIRELSKKIEDNKTSTKILNKISKGIDKFSKQKMTYKQGKTQRMTAQIDEFKAPSVLGDENRFFNKTMEEEKKKLFFS